jgi:hypothetical protein
MKRLALFGAAALVVAALIPTDASAQRGRGIGAGGVRVAAIGRGVGVGGGYAIRSAAIGRRVGWVGRPGVRWVGRWRPGWDLPIPVTIYNGAGNGYAIDYGYASYAPQGYGSCVGWDGLQWVNACYYQPPPIAGGGQYVAPY